MIKKLTYTSLLWMVFSWVVLAQTESDTLFRTVSKRLHEFQYNAPREKVYVHQDRTQYVAGETMWFKAYQSSSPDFPVESGVVYVELIDGMNQAVAETKWKLENGSAAGHIELPDTLTSGLYQLRAYTGWMQNFDAEGFFTRELTIASRYAASQENPTNAAEAGKALAEDLPLEEMPERKVELAFFPEGGNLVAGLPSKIAFKVTDRAGKGIEASGVVCDQDGNEVRRFETQHRGMGSFALEPEIGKQYIARLDGMKVQVALPEIYAQGLVMSLGYRDDRLRITLRHNLDAVRTQTPFHLTIHQEGIPWFNAHVNMQERTTVFDIPKEKLPVGLFVITLYDDNLHAYAERLAFVNHPEQLEIHAKADQAVYASRQKVTVEIDVPELYDAPQTGDFSVAVVKANLEDADTQNNLFTDYFLTSELRGRIEQPTYYFNANDTLVAQHLDLLLQTHGWRRYVWDNVVSGKTPEISFPVEQQLSFAGKIYPRSKNQKMEEVEITASFRQDAVSDFLSFHPDKEGLFQFVYDDFCDTAEVILSAQDQRKRILDISLIERQKTPHNYFSYAEEDADDESQEVYVELLGTIPQGNLVDIDQTVHELPEISVTVKRKQYPHKDKVHDENLALHTYEVRREASYGSSAGALSILWYIPKKLVRDLGNYFMKGGSGDNIYFLLDGVRTSAANIKTIPPHFIDHVELLSFTTAMRYTSQYAMGETTFYPIAFWTRDRLSYSEPVKSVTYQFPGFSQIKEFYAPDYATVNDVRKADFRNTLYWQPHVTINADGKAEFSFFTSDDKGEYLIHYEGRSDNGEIGVTSSFIHIQ
ncbi:hypothetical protein [Parabacteroides sp. PF5-6]|uniref:hypothetical protein n=1 Tax=Parabacteroides sp. PF5-6 TaxID=1742403 RepID=UPI002404960D|nr:hypothetical protein [Parabacteroides sp. PF5-6]MDF9830399.1 hypothetical protein [Parabacteroides sp. PF5-6]